MTSRLSCTSTYYSLRYETLSPEYLVKAAKKHCLSCLVLTDINNTSAHFDFYRACQKSLQLKDFPNHLGRHAGGEIITDRPINYCTALQMIPKGFPIVQFDMHVAEDYKFHKYNLLSQRGLGHIKETVKLVGGPQWVKAKLGSLVLLVVFKGHLYRVE